jgi:hypothetical protein
VTIPKIRDSVRWPWSLSNTKDVLAAAPALALSSSHLAHHSSSDPARSNRSTLGNLVGGALLVAVVCWFAWARPRHLQLMTEQVDDAHD